MEDKKLKAKYGKSTLSISILERAIGEEELKNLIKEYDKSCQTRGGSGLFESVSHKDVYMLYKGGKPLDELAKLFRVPKSRIHESLFLGAEQFLRDNE